MHNSREFVVNQHQRGGLTRHVGTASAHRDAYMCRAKGRCIVHAVTRHGDNIAARFERLNNAKLLIRCDACTDTDGGNALA